MAKERLYGARRMKVVARRWLSLVAFIALIFKLERDLIAPSRYLPPSLRSCFHHAGGKFFPR